MLDTGAEFCKVASHSRRSLTATSVCWITIGVTCIAVFLCTLASSITASFPYPVHIRKSNAGAEVASLASSRTAGKAHRMVRRARQITLKRHGDLDNTLLSKAGGSVGSAAVRAPIPAPYTGRGGRTYAPLPIIFDQSQNLHLDRLEPHPEQPARIESCLNSLLGLQSERVQLVDVSTESNNRFSSDDLNYARAMLVEAHTEDFVADLQTRCDEEKQRLIANFQSPFSSLGYIAEATYITTETFDVCLRAAASWIQAVDIAMEQKSAAAMALTRPPGHHAGISEISGFCFFNFASAAAIHALQRDSQLKVSILDWDVHYGQGVSEIIGKRDRARYVSIHQKGIYPQMEEKFRVFGDYNNIMVVPVDDGTTWAGGFEQAFVKKALPFIRTEGEWEPDLVIICAGYDAMLGEELAGVKLQAPDYKLMTELLVEHLSKNRAKPPGLMFGLEGGYNVKPSCEGGNLADGVVETVKALIE